MSTITLFINQKCNRRCTYCDIPSIRKPETVNKELLKTYIPLINKSDFNRVILTGGEIGLLDEESIELLMSIQKLITVNTNGLFFKRGYWDKYKDKINRVLYHPISEIDQDIPVIYYETNIQYLVPVHANNIYLLDSFLKKYCYINFEISPYDSKLKTDLVLTKKDFNRILKIILNRKNVTESTINTFKRLISLSEDSIINTRNLCNNIYKEIDLVKGLINNCICSYTRSSKIPLTEENFKNINDLVFRTTNLCNNCLSCIVWFDEIIHNSIKGKK